MIRFDESLEQFVVTACNALEPHFLEDATVVREAGGRLSVFLAKELSSELRRKTEDSLREALGPYARSDGVLRTPNDPGTKRVLEEGKSSAILKKNGSSFRFIDRRIVGADWLKPPVASSSRPRIVFASLKGGVGRSTALCVTAAHLSRQGIRVLAVDLDFEAPGLGSMLLTPSETPRYGTIDYLLENGLGGIDDVFLQDALGSSFLGKFGASVRIVPAIGNSTLNHPENALGKISRAYLEDLRPDGGILSLADQISEMVNHFESLGSTDITLVDARAGLNETTAAALLGLGADVLLFGTDQPQTYQGYRLLLSHLSTFPIKTSDDWRDRLNFVHAKATDTTVLGAKQRFEELYRILGYGEARVDEAEDELSGDDLNVEWDDTAWIEPEDFEPQPVLSVSDDPRFRDFDPARDPACLDEPAYRASFASVIAFADGIMMSAGEASQ